MSSITDIFTCVKLQVSFVIYFFNLKSVSDTVCITVDVYMTIFVIHPVVENDFRLEKYITSET